MNKKYLLLGAVVALIIVLLVAAPRVEENVSPLDQWTLLHIATNALLGVVCAWIVLHYKKVGIGILVVWVSVELLVVASITGIIGWEFLEQGPLVKIWQDASESTVNTLTDILVGIPVYLAAFYATLRYLKRRE